MLKRLLAVAVVTGCLGVVGHGDARAQAQERTFSQIGPWKIIVHNEKGRFHRCIAELHSRSGMLRIAHFPSGTWNFSIPCFGEGRAQMADVNLNRASDRMRMSVDGRSCRAWTDPLSGGWVGALRAGGNLSVKLGRRTGEWRLTNTGAALGSVQDCLRANR